MPSDVPGGGWEGRTVASPRQEFSQAGAHVPSDAYVAADDPRPRQAAEPATRRLDRSARQAGESPERTLLRPVAQVPRAQPTPAQMPYVPAPRAAVPSPRREAFSPEPARRHGGFLSSLGGLLARLALWLLALACRLAALGLSALVAADAVVVGSHRVQLLELTARVSQLLPRALSGALLFETPLGGVLRLDFAIAALALFVLDWLLSRASRR